VKLLESSSPRHPRARRDRAGPPTTKVRERDSAIAHASARRGRRRARRPRLLGVAMMGRGRSAGETTDLLLGPRRVNENRCSSRAGCALNRSPANDEGTTERRVRDRRGRESEVASGVFSTARIMTRRRDRSPLPLATRSYSDSRRGTLCRTRALTSGTSSPGLGPDPYRRDRANTRSSRRASAEKRPRFGVVCDVT